MSVYCLGKLVSHDRDACSSFLRSTATTLGMGVSFDIDPDDELVLSEVKSLKPAGLAFAMFSRPDDSDVIEAWNVARDAGLRALGGTQRQGIALDAQTIMGDFVLPAAVELELGNTDLGRFASRIISFREVSAAGLAFFDGGISQIVVQRPEKCLRQILASFLLPWDAGPDVLHVWEPREPH